MRRVSWWTAMVLVGVSTVLVAGLMSRDPSGIGQEATPVAPAASPTAQPTRTITGDVTLSLYYDEISDDLQVCDGPRNREEMSPPYGAGVHSGSKVVVRNEKGVIIALGTLGRGEKTESDNPGCRFPLEVERVPNARFYEVSIFSFAGDPTLYFSASELRAADWDVHFTVP